MVEVLPETRTAAREPKSLRLDEHDLRSLRQGLLAQEFLAREFQALREISIASPVAAYGLLRQALDEVRDMFRPCRRSLLLRGSARLSPTAIERLFAHDLEMLDVLRDVLQPWIRFQSGPVRFAGPKRTVRELNWAWDVPIVWPQIAHSAGACHYLYRTGQEHVTCVARFPSVGANTPAPLAWTLEPPIAGPKNWVDAWISGELLGPVGKDQVEQVRENPALAERCPRVGLPRLLTHESSLLSAPLVLPTPEAMKDLWVLWLWWR